MTSLGVDLIMLAVGSPAAPVFLPASLVPQPTASVLASKPSNGFFYFLPDESLAIFEIYRLYLFYNKIYSRGADDNDGVVDDGQDVHEDREWHRLANCYLLGLTLDDEKFRNMVVEAFVEKVKETDRMPTDLASEVWYHSEDNDRLRKLLVDLHVYLGQGTFVSAADDDVHNKLTRGTAGEFIRAPHNDRYGPQEFVAAVHRAKLLAGQAIFEPNAKWPWENAHLRCFMYHCHTATQPCGFTATQPCGFEVLDLTAAD